MIILLKLILAHLLGDYVLQPSSWVAEKELLKGQSLKLYFHVMIHGMLAMILLWNWVDWPIVLSIMLAHLLIDLIKMYSQRPQTKTTWFIIDQLLHIVSILTIYIIFTGVKIDFAQILSDPKILAFITSILFLTQPASILFATILKKWSDSIPSQPDQSLQHAGKYIGILERLFVFTFILTGHWEAVGFLLAAKSVFRFGDLKKSKERKLTEYILIGTLISFGTAMLTALLYLSII
jgi:hypothetical protein